MKKIFLGTASLLLAVITFSQVKEGVITYERTVQLNIQIADNNPQIQQMIPRERKDRFDLLFANNKSLWKPAESDNTQEDMAMEEGGARIVMRMPGMDGWTMSDHMRGRTRCLRGDDGDTRMPPQEQGAKTLGIGHSSKNTRYDRACGVPRHAPA